MLVDRLGVSERRACQIAGQHRSTQRREPCIAPDDAALRARLREISAERPRWGYRRAHARLLEDGWVLNRKRTQRVWREEGLRVPQRRRKRQRLGESTVPASRLRAERPNHVWALDFQFDQTADGRILKLLHIVDEFTREALAMECHRRIDADGRDARAARPGPWPRPAVHSLRQRARAHRERAARLVPFREDRDRLHRARLAVAEPLRRVVQLQGSRRAARRRAVQLPRRGQGPRRRLARGLQPPPAPLGARDDGPGPVRDRLEEGPAGRARCLAPLAATRLRSARQRR